MSAQHRQEPPTGRRSGQLSSDFPSETASIWGPSTAWIRSIVWILATFFLAALSIDVCKLSLSPIYGSMSSEANAYGPMVLLILMSIIGMDKDHNTFGLLIPGSGYIPPLALYFLNHYSGRLGPIWGPRLSIVFSTFPLFLGACASPVGMLNKIGIWTATTIVGSRNVSLRRLIQLVPTVIFGYFFFQGFKAFQVAASFFISWLRNSKNELLSSRYGLQVVIAILWTSLARSKWTASLAILPVLHVLFFSPHLPFVHNTAIVNATLHANGWSLVARQESLTGYISVLDNVKDGFRVMRCDHSLLGGEWTRKPKGHPAKFNEPIYSIFVMLEAVRLVQTKSVTISEKPSKNALIIGLGVGTAPSALIAHGVHTTTVEIDPVVHRYASDYFNLPENHTSIIGDALTIVKDLQLETTKKRYDYIIHDVFTGGAEPIDLFTNGFLGDLENLLNEEGVIAINYAGDLLLPSAVSVIRTVLSVFGHCRVFRESPALLPLGAEDYTNVVMFCCKSRADFTFRDPVEADFLGSPARRQHLLPQNEVHNLQSFAEGEVLRKGQTEWLGASQRHSAVGHWHVMRKVLPDVVWENW